MANDGSLDGSPAAVERKVSWMGDGSGGDDLAALSTVDVVMSTGAPLVHAAGDVNMMDVGAAAPDGDVTMTTKVDAASSDADASNNRMVITTADVVATASNDAAPALTTSNDTTMADTVAAAAAGVATASPPPPQRPTPSTPPSPPPTPVAFPTAEEGSVAQDLAAARADVAALIDGSSNGTPPPAPTARGTGTAREGADAAAANPALVSLAAAPKVPTGVAVDSPPVGAASGTGGRTDGGHVEHGVSKAAGAAKELSPAEMATSPTGDADHPGVTEGLPTPVMPRVSVADRLGWTPLHMAALADDGPTAAALAAGGTSLRVRDGTGRTPLHVAATAGAAAVVVALLAAGASPMVADDSGGTPLHAAASCPAASTPDIVEALLRGGVPVGATDSTGGTPLHVAAAANAAGVVMALTAEGAPVDVPDAHGWTPLHVAASGGHREAAAALVAAGADAAAADGRAGWTPLHAAAAGGWAAVIGDLLCRPSGKDARHGVPACVEAADAGGLTALHWAAVGGHIAAVRALLAGGAVPDAADADGQAASAWAAAAGHAGVAAVPVAVATGYGFALLLTSAGRVWATGNNAFGRLGARVTPPPPPPPPPPPSRPLAGLPTPRQRPVDNTAGFGREPSPPPRSPPSPSHSAAGATARRVVVVALPPSAGPAVAVAAGANHGLALTASGEVAGWGLDDDGQVGGAPDDADPAGAVIRIPQLVTAVAAAATAAGTTVTGVAAGWVHSLAVCADGGVLSWGDNRDVVAAAAGRRMTVFLDADGGVWVAGLAPAGLGGDGMSLAAVTPRRVADLVGIRCTGIAAGYDFLLALSAGGVVYAAGDDGSGSDGSGLLPPPSHRGGATRPPRSVVAVVGLLGRRVVAVGAGGRVGATPVAVACLGRQGGGGAPPPLPATAAGTAGAATAGGGRLEVRLAPSFHGILRIRRWLPPSPQSTLPRGPPPWLTVDAAGVADTASGRGGDADGDRSNTRSNCGGGDSGDEGDGDGNGDGDSGGGSGGSAGVGVPSAPSPLALLPTLPPPGPLGADLARALTDIRLRPLADVAVTTAGDDGAASPVVVLAAHAAVLRARCRAAAVRMVPVDPAGECGGPPGDPRPHYTLDLRPAREGAVRLLLRYLYTHTLTTGREGEGRALRPERGVVHVGEEVGTPGGEAEPSSPVAAGGVWRCPEEAAVSVAAAPLSPSPMTVDVSGLTRLARQLRLGSLLSVLEAASPAGRSASPPSPPSAAAAAARTECAICLTDGGVGSGGGDGGGPLPASSPRNQRAGALVPQSCGHAFHAPCIARWAAYRNACPLCLRRLSPAGEHPPSDSIRGGPALLDVALASDLAAAAAAAAPPLPDTVLRVGGGAAARVVSVLAATASPVLEAAILSALARPPRSSRSSPQVSTPLAAAAGGPSYGLSSSSSPSSPDRGLFVAVARLPAHVAAVVPPPLAPATLNALAAYLLTRSLPTGTPSAVLPPLVAVAAALQLDGLASAAVAAAAAATLTAPPRVLVAAAAAAAVGGEGEARLRAAVLEAADSRLRAAAGGAATPGTRPRQRQLGAGTSIAAVGTTAATAVLPRARRVLPVNASDVELQAALQRLVDADDARAATATPAATVPALVVG
ncbi:hypothetical protein MMPV_005458 [Pyropia vietnamensis]